MALNAIMRFLPFSKSTTTLQAVAYLLGVSLFSISFLVFLNSSITFVITDLIGVEKGVGDIVGTLGFVDELVALVACPVWGLVSDRLGVRFVAMVGYAIIGLSLFLFVQAVNVYPQLLLARVLFALGATATATMVTATLPCLTDDPFIETDTATNDTIDESPQRSNRHSTTASVDSELTITPERFSRSSSHDRAQSTVTVGSVAQEKPSILAGYVGLATGLGALLALLVFLPLPARFGGLEGVDSGDAIIYSYYVVGAVAILVAGFVYIGLRKLKGEEGKGFRTLFGLKKAPTSSDTTPLQNFLPYKQLLREAVALGFTDPKIGIAYLGGFVARASTVAISAFIPLFVKVYYLETTPAGADNEQANKRAITLAAILTGVAQLLALICAPVFGYLARRKGRFNYPLLIAAIFGVIGYVTFPKLHSPEIKNINGREGSPLIFLVVSLLGISQIGAIVCSLGSLGQGVLATESEKKPTSSNEGRDGSGEQAPLLGATANKPSRVLLKGTIAGIYSWCGGAAILLLTKLGGHLFDVTSHGAPFYMMAIFNGILLVAVLSVDISQAVAERRQTTR